MLNRQPEDKYPIIFLEERTYGKHCWVIRTMNEEYPRYVETGIKWGKQWEYSLVPNIHYAKVWLGISPPYRAIENFEKRTGIKACFQEVPLEAYNHFKLYESYYNGDRELTEDEEKQLKQEWLEWRMEHDLEENRKHY